MTCLVRPITAGLLPALFAVLAGPAVAQAVLVVSQPADIRATQPGVDRDNTTDGVLLHVVEGLVAYRENGSVGPLLAQDVKVSKDGLTYTFQLRKGVKFHNGAPMTARDVAWNWRRYMEPKTQWRCLGEFDGRGSAKVVSASAPDPFTFVMRLDKPSAVFLDTLARTDCGMTGIVHSSSLKSDGTWDKPIGTGPFAFTEWKRGESVTLSAFKEYQSPPGQRPDGYTGLKQPLVDAVKFTVASTPATTRAALESGTADVGPITTTDAQELTFGASFSGKTLSAKTSTPAVAEPKADDRDRFIKVLISRQSNKNALLLQTRDPVLKKEGIRRAIAMALDARMIVAMASEGMASVNPSAVPAGSAFHSAVHKARAPFDVAQARKLLADAGYRGEKITIQANKRANVPSHAIALRAQAMLREVGIDAQVEVLDWPVQLERYNKGDFQISSFTYSSRLDPGLSYEQLVGDKTVEPRKVWDDPTARRLIDASLVESDPARRQAIFDEVHALMLAQVPAILLYNGIDTWGARRRVSGFSVWEGKPRAWNTRLTAPR
jgi:peptide/nickel transport system substrate-binding protein